MRMRVFAVAAAAVLIATPALASSCPRDMAAIDAALATNPQLSAAQMTRVKELRADGEAQHKAGNHRASVRTLARAKAMLDARR